MKSKILIMLIMLLVLMTACGKQIQIIEVNNTIKEIHTINNTVQCKEIECICNCNCPKEKECEEFVYDDYSLRQCRIQTARLIGQVDYYKNLSVIYLLNDTFDNLQVNLTECLEDKDELQDRLDKINESLTN